MHVSLLHKLNCYRSLGQIFGLILSFVCNRWFQVVLDLKCSQEYPVNARVPQGFIALGPTTFSYYTLMTFLIVGRGVLTPLFYEAPLYCLPHPLPFFKFCSCPPLCHRQPAPPLLFLLSCFFAQMGDCTTFDVLFCLMTCSQTLLPQYQKDLHVCFTQQGIKFTEV